MKTFKRICIKEHTVTDTEGKEFTVERGKEYLTSEVYNDRTCTILSSYWVKMPMSVNGKLIFAGAIPGLGESHNKLHPVDKFIKGQGMHLAHMPLKVILMKFYNSLTLGG